jgi:hypothetical protein
LQSTSASERPNHMVWQWASSREDQSSRRIQNLVGSRSVPHSHSADKTVGDGHPVSSREGIIHGGNSTTGNQEVVDPGCLSLGSCVSDVGNSQRQEFLIGSF